jgi:CRISPR-associated protein Csb1
VFGAWDSRDTQAKLPRLVASSIRAYDVRPVTRSAQYIPALDYVSAGALEEPVDKATRDAYAERGFVHVPSSGAHGGVIADGPIRREATLHLVALRRLAAADLARTRTLQRYILGLALTAFTYSPSGFLRQGCNLVLDPDRPREFSVVWPDGRREPADVGHDRALAFARDAASAFGIDPSRSIPAAGVDRDVQFDKELARKDVSGDGEKPGKARKKREGKG